MSTIQIIILVAAILMFAVTTLYFAWQYYRYRKALHALFNSNVTASDVQHLQLITSEIVSELSSYKDKGTRVVVLQLEINSDDETVKMKLSKSPNNLKKP